MRKTKKKNVGDFELLLKYTELRVIDVKVRDL